jgi:hypothetical protein
MLEMHRKFLFRKPVGKRHNIKISQDADFNMSDTKYKREFN